MTELSKAEIENLFLSEGSPTLGSTSYPEKTINKIVQSFFHEKTPPHERSAATVKILLGAPGAGKSYNAAKDYDALDETTKNQTIYVSYDENGAIYQIPGFKEELVKILGRDFQQHEEIDPDSLTAEKYSQIEAVWEKYRPLSQHIRAQILKQAAAEGYSMVIDTTSSSPGTLKMIDALKTAGYFKEQIEIEGTYAPIEISRSRIERRARKASYLELITKRIGDPAKHNGALNMIEPLIKAVGKFTYRYNPDNQNPPREAFVFENGALVRHDSEIVGQIFVEAHNDMMHLKDLIPMVAAASKQNAEGLKDSINHAIVTTARFRDFIVDRIFCKRPLPAPAPT